MTDIQTPQPAEVVQQVKGTVGISFNSPTPMWATWIFRVEFFLNKALMMWIASTDIIPSNKLKVVIATFTAVDFFVWGIGRSIGVRPPDDPSAKTK